uniref:Uncharacterized protein n=1 Tax=Chrysemys picta bellii TaxID=8478 RepID=A0A8C3HCS5_CHRPI
MTVANPALTLQDEVTCPIYLDYFKDPVSLYCDHNFCLVHGLVLADSLFLWIQTNKAIPLYLTPCKALIL